MKKVTELIKFPVATISMLIFSTISAASVNPEPIIKLNAGSNNTISATSWGAGTTNGRWNIPYYINFQSIPAGMTQNDAIQAVQKAATKWEQVCNLKFTYNGTTAIQPETPIGGSRPTTMPVIIGFSSNSSSIPAYVVNQLLSNTPSSRHSDMQLFTSFFPQRTTAGQEDFQKTFLTNTLTHELGHVIGLGDINNGTTSGGNNAYNVTVMMNQPGYVSMSGTYWADHQATMRGADVKGCQSIYGAPSDQQALAINRALNFLEGEDYNWGSNKYVSWDFLGHPGEITQYGYFGSLYLAYRYYPRTNKYIGISTNESPKKAYLLPPGGTTLQFLQTLDSLSTSVNTIDNNYGVTRY